MLRGAERGRGHGQGEGVDKAGAWIRRGRGQGEGVDNTYLKFEQGRLLRLNSKKRAFLQAVSLEGVW